MKKLDASRVFYLNGLHIARMVGGSKSLYKEANPYHEVYFNANIVTLNHGKVWYGDLDIDNDKEKLIKIAKELDEALYILYEMDARFENEDKPIFELLSKAQCTIWPDGNIESKNREHCEELKASGENPYKIIRLPLTDEQTTKIVEKLVDFQLSYHGLTAEDVKHGAMGDWFDKYSLTEAQYEEYKTKATNYLTRYYKLDEDQVNKVLGEFGLFYSLRIENAEAG